MPINKCPVCYRNLPSVFTHDPLHLIEGCPYYWLNNTTLALESDLTKRYYKGLDQIKLADIITELQADRTAREQDLLDPLNYTTFTSVNSSGKFQITKKHIEELRTSTEKLLIASGLSKSEYFNYDEDGNHIIHPKGDKTEWTDPTLSNKFQIKASHVEDLRRAMFSSGLFLYQSDTVLFYKLTPDLVLQKEYSIHPYILAPWFLAVNSQYLISLSGTGTYHSYWRMNINNLNDYIVYSINGGQGYTYDNNYAWYTQTYLGNRYMQGNTSGLFQIDGRNPTVRGMTNDINFVYLTVEVDYGFFLPNKSYIVKWDKALNKIDSYVEIDTTFTFFNMLGRITCDTNYLYFIRNYIFGYPYPTNVELKVFTKNLTLVATLPLYSGYPIGVTSVTTDGSYLYILCPDGLRKYNLSLTLIATNTDYNSILGREIVHTKEFATNMLV